MCHHPFHWLRGGAQLKDHLNSTARIQLFGHEHIHRIELGRDWVRVAAGAVHPDRGEPGWEPGYNWLQVHVRNDGQRRELEVTTHVRVWQEAPDLFRPKMDRRNVPFFRHVIELEPWIPPVAPIEPPSSPSTVSTVPIVADTVVAIPDSERSDPMNTLRDLSLEFFKLTLSQKNAIAGKLGLLEEEDINQPDFERFLRVFLRARDRGLVAELGREVKAAGSQDRSQSVVDEGVHLHG